MDWWILEALTTGLLVALVVLLGPFIKRFGRNYATEVFRAVPGTGRSYIGLLDIAYYLIFSAFILFTIQFERPDDWTQQVGAAQVFAETLKVGGMLLLLGVLHAVNLITLPIVGRLLTLNRQLDEELAQMETGEDTL